MIYAICGPIGAGKSQYQLRRVIEMAQRDRKWIVSNVPLNLDVLHEYCIRRKFYWLAAQIRRGLVFYDADFSRVSLYGRCVILADELGIFMNNREGQSGDDKVLRMRFIKALILSRKAKTDMFWVAQDEELVDQQIRRLTQFYIHCYNSEPKWQFSTPTRYYIRTIYEGSVKYQRWFKSQRFAAWLRYKMGSTFSMPGNPLFCAVFGDHDELLFKAYNTNYRLDESQVHYMDAVASELGVADDVERSGVVYHGLGVQTPGKLQPIQVPAGYVPGTLATLAVEHQLQVDDAAPVVDGPGYRRRDIHWVRTVRAKPGRREVWHRNKVQASGASQHDGPRLRVGVLERA